MRRGGIIYVLLGKLFPSHLHSIWQDIQWKVHGQPPFLICKSATSAPVVKVSNTLSWAHQLACVEDPTQCLFAKQVLTGAKQILAHRTQKKEPITPVIFEQLVSKSPGKEAPLSDICIVTVCLIGFAGFLRLNEMDNLKESDVQVFDEHMKLFIESS